MIRWWTRNWEVPTLMLPPASIVLLIENVSVGEMRAALTFMDPDLWGREGNEHICMWRAPAAVTAQSDRNKRPQSTSSPCARDLAELLYSCASSSSKAVNIKSNYNPLTCDNLPSLLTPLTQYQTSDPFWDLVWPNSSLSQRETSLKN